MSDAWKQQKTMQNAKTTTSPKWSVQNGDESRGNKLKNHLQQTEN